LYRRCDGADNVRTCSKPSQDKSL